MARFDWLIRPESIRYDQHAMSNRRTFLLALAALASISLARTAAQPAPAAGTLTVAGDVSTPLTIAAAALKSMPRKQVEAKDEGRTVVYEGVLVAEILKRAGVPLGPDLRGPALATYVVASASDGYQVLFSLPELDPALTANDIIIADTIDGRALLPHQGPLRIVAPKDARGSRSIRMLQRLEVVRLRK